MSVPRARRPLAGLWVAFLATAWLGPGPAAAAPQDEDGQRVERREIVVIRPGSSPALVRERLGRRGFLGVELLDLTPELRHHFGAPGDRGVLVARVEAESPAAAADVRVGDLITAVDGRPIAEPIELVARIAPREQGDEVEIELRRDGASLRVRARLAERERQQVELGQFLWRDEDGENEIVRLGPGGAGKVIAIDPESIDRSVRELLDRFELRGPGAAPGLDPERRRLLERRIELLEERLREMERRLEKREQGNG